MFKYLAAVLALVAGSVVCSTIAQAMMMQAMLRARPVPRSTTPWPARYTQAPHIKPPLSNTPRHLALPTFPRIPPAFAGNHSCLG